MLKERESVAKVNLHGFSPVKFVFGAIQISGGHVKKPMPVIAKTVTNQSGTANMTFVKLSTNEPWLQYATTGHKRSSGGSFGRTSLLEALREKVLTFCNDAAPSSSGDAIAAEEYDPMMEVEQPEEDTDTTPSKIKRQGQKRMRYLTNPVKDSVVTFAMPVRCPEEDPDCTAVRNIKLYIVDRKTIWLHIDDVEWAVRYLYVQNFLKGVPLVPDDSSGPQ